MNITNSYTQQWVCIECNYVNKEILTVGKVYEIITETNIDPFTNADLSISSFIGDDGKSYLIDFTRDNAFIPLDEYRQQKLNYLLK
jgi:hypothetical protein